MRPAEWIRVRPRVSQLRTRRAVVTALCALAFGVFAASASAATVVTYFFGEMYPGNGAADVRMDYRNFNDSCTGGTVSGSRNYGWTRATYGLSDGTWVANIQVYNYCSGSPDKAHLGPSSDYGYTYVQSKCGNTDSVELGMTCWTTEP